MHQRAEPRTAGTNDITRDLLDAHVDVVKASQGSPHGRLVSCNRGLRRGHDLDGRPLRGCDRLVAAVPPRDIGAFIAGADFRSHILHDQIVAAKTERRFGIEVEHRGLRRPPDDGVRLIAAAEAVLARAHGPHRRRIAIRPLEHGVLAFERGATGRW